MEARNGSSRSSSKAENTKLGNITKQHSNNSSGGWKKGFLMANNKTTIQKTNRRLSTTSLQESNGAADDNGIAPSLATTSATVVSNNIESTKRRGVSFAIHNNEIKEIPRIGHMKIPPRLTTTKTASFSSSSSSSSSLSLQPSTAIPTIANTTIIEDNVFHGIVKERSCTNDNSSNSNNSILNANQQDMGNNMTTKKLSRFAQQRLQQQQR